AWIIAALVFLMGVTIRHYFNTMHARQGRPNWTWAATAMIFIAIAWLSTVPRPDERPMTQAALRFAEDPHFAAAAQAVRGNCSMCHARETAWDGVPQAPKGVYLETDADIAAHAREVYLQAGVSHAMPPPGAFAMPGEARAAIRTWYRAATAPADRRAEAIP
ncbi:MAG: urate hydroxylase PuuD, partial [Shimia sp.]